MKPGGMVLTSKMNFPIDSGLCIASVVQWSLSQTSLKTILWFVISKCIFWYSFVGWNYLWFCIVFQWNHNMVNEDFHWKSICFSRKKQVISLNKTSSEKNLKSWNYLFIFQNSLRKWSVGRWCNAKSEIDRKVHFRGQNHPTRFHIDLSHFRSSPIGIHHMRIPSGVHQRNLNSATCAHRQLLILCSSKISPRPRRD